MAASKMEMMQRMAPASYAGWTALSKSIMMLSCTAMLAVKRRARFSQLAVVVSSVTCLKSTVFFASCLCGSFMSASRRVGVI